MKLFSKILVSIGLGLNLALLMFCNNDELVLPPFEEITEYPISGNYTIKFEATIAKEVTDFEELSEQKTLLLSRKKDNKYIISKFNIQTAYESEIISSSNYISGIYGFYKESNAIIYGENDSEDVPNYYKLDLDTKEKSLIGTNYNACYPGYGSTVMCRVMNGNYYGFTSNLALKKCDDCALELITDDAKTNGRFAFFNGFLLVVSLRSDYYDNQLLFYNYEDNQYELTSISGSTFVTDRENGYWYYVDEFDELTKCQLATNGRPSCESITIADYPYVMRMDDNKQNIYIAYYIGYSGGKVITEIWKIPVNDGNSKEKLTDSIVDLNSFYLDFEGNLYPIYYQNDSYTLEEVNTSDQSSTEIFSDSLILGYNQKGYFPLTYQNVETGDIYIYDNSKSIEIFEERILGSYAVPSLHDNSIYLLESRGGGIHKPLYYLERD